MRLSVFYEMILPIERFAAVDASVGFESRVGNDVPGQVFVALERLAALSAAVRTVFHVVGVGAMFLGAPSGARRFRGRHRTDRPSYAGGSSQHGASTHSAGSGYVHSEFRAVGIL